MLNFTLTDLRYLVALSEEKHFARAAQRCFVAQPTLSIAIKKLEDNLGVSIFERDNHQILVTAAGSILIEQAKRILGEANNLLSLASTNHDPLAQPLRLGAILTVGPYLFPQLMHQVMIQLPKLKLVIEENYTHALTEKLLNGEIDAIILGSEIQHHEFIQQPIAQDELGLICARTNPLARRRKIDPNTLGHQPFLLLSSGHCLREQVLKACPQTDLNHNQLANLITSSSLETIKQMVAMDLGVSIIPRLAAAKLPRTIVIKPLTPMPILRQLSLVYRKNFTRHGLIQQLQPIINNILCN